MIRHFVYLVIVSQGLSTSNASSLNPTIDNELPQMSSYQNEFYQGIETNHETLDERIKALSSIFLGTPYVSGSLGEGELGVYDNDPLTRLNEFDCTTYVETVLAGVLSESTNDFMPNLMALRYKDAQVSFVTRNHFPSLDWLPNNQDTLKDITDLIAIDLTQVAKTTVDKSAWYKTISDNIVSCNGDLACYELQAQFRDEGGGFSPELATLNYVPLTALFLEDSDVKGSKRLNLSILDKIPSGSVISMVRPNWLLKKWIGTNMNVSHQGIAIRKGGQLFLRHASERYKKVIDENFVKYFSRYPSTSSLKGFNVQILKP